MGEQLGYLFHLRHTARARECLLLERHTIRANIPGRDVSSYSTPREDGGWSVQYVVDFLVLVLR